MTIRPATVADAGPIVAYRLDEFFESRGAPDRARLEKQQARRQRPDLIAYVDDVRKIVVELRPFPGRGEVEITAWLPFSGPTQEEMAAVLQAALLELVKREPKAATWLCWGSLSEANEQKWADWFGPSVVDVNPARGTVSALLAVMARKLR